MPAITDQLRPTLSRFTPALILILFLILRLTNLTLLPIFSDEANYLDWGWRSVHTGQPYHSLYDAKQPFLMWMFGVGQTIFPDPLWGSRFVSVVTGLLNVFGLYLLGRTVFNRRTGFVAALLYTLIPTFLFYDRQALMESSLMSVSIWSLYFLIQLHHSQKIRYALAVGSLLGIGIFIKSSASVFLFTFIILHLIASLRQKDKLFLHLSLGVYAAMAFLVVLGPLLLQEQFWTTLGRNSDYAFTAVELLGFPAAAWIRTFWANIQVIFLTFTPGVLAAGLWGISQLKTRQHLSHLLMAGWLIIPLTVYLLVVKNPNSLVFRYSSPFLPLLTLTAAGVLAARPKLLAVFLIPAAFLSSLLVLRPPDYFRFLSRLTPYSYIQDYVTGYGTGYQVEALLGYFNNQEPNQPIVVGMEVTSFNPGAALLSYFRNHPRITTAFLDARLFGNQLDRIDCLKADTPVYFLDVSGKKGGLKKFLIQTGTVGNHYNPETHTIYKLNQNCTGETVSISLTQN